MYAESSVSGDLYTSIETYQSNVSMVSVIARNAILDPILEIVIHDLSLQMARNLQHGTIN